MIAKRLFDLLASGLGLVLLSPFLLLIALVVKIDSPGPVFFRQERVGQYGRLFRIHKFRTMVLNAESAGRSITVGDDARITRFGYFLRRYKIDEIPQLIDVFIGDMSLVGPRPEVPKYVEHYPDHLRKIVLSVRPGITDRVSIEFRSESDILGAAVDPEACYIDRILPIKLGYYVEYVQSRSFLDDIRIILKTLSVVF